MPGVTRSGNSISMVIPKKWAVGTAIRKAMTIGIMDSLVKIITTFGTVAPSTFL